MVPVRIRSTLRPRALLLKVRAESERFETGSGLLRQAQDRPFDTRLLTQPLLRMRKGEGLPARLLFGMKGVEAQRLPLLLILIPAASTMDS